MFKKYIKLIAITCLDFFALVSLAVTLPGFIGDFILELQSSLDIISRPNLAGPGIVFLQVLFLLIFAFLVIYLNINEYNKSKNNTK